MKKRTIRLVAILACFSILTLAVPGATAADKKVKKFNFINILQKPILALSPIFPFLSPIYDTGNSCTLPDNNTYTKKIKITDGKGKPKPPDGGD